MEALHQQVDHTEARGVSKHPSKFRSRCNGGERKQEIMDDLSCIQRRAEEFYARIGRALEARVSTFRLAGTGKSTMIAAMANLLNYDIYDLEPISVKDNTEVEEVADRYNESGSIIVIEDIDRSLDLTRSREEEEGGGGGGMRRIRPKSPKEESETKRAESLFRGILNFVDPDFGRLCKAEHLMPKTISDDAMVCLESPIGGLEKAKEDAYIESQEEVKESLIEGRGRRKEKEKEKEKAKVEDEEKGKRKRIHQKV
ncbi:hypothetical protein OIU85_003706 [Salix viminalis]|uniref:ATPase AAA-type core domain-containing protein n=1 Tax=Salix viminalis TaxID=40686 RepID=A0A9Q0PZN9_SALVM|nr:hypothetical protein OIU85_003706 [Salix viminalis]